MVKGPLKLPGKPVPEEDAEASPQVDVAAEVSRAEPEIAVSPHSQKRRQDLGRYWLQIDRQTKESFATAAAAEKAGLAIKMKFRQVQVAIYDRDESSNRILELPE